MSSTLKVNGIQAVSGTANAISLTASDKTCTANITNNLSNRNLIINGAMNVAQRGTAAVTTSDGSNEGYQTVDRWQTLFAGSAGGALSTEQSTDAPDGFKNSVLLKCTTASTSLSGSEHVLYRTKLEGQDVLQLEWGKTSPKSVTLSWYMKAVNPKTLAAQLTTPVGSGRYYLKKFTPTTSWARYTWTIPGDSTALVTDHTEGLAIQFGLHIGSSLQQSADSTAWSGTAKHGVSGQGNFLDSTSNQLFITGVQLEVSDYATDFEHRKFQDELYNCQRYYQQIGKSGQDGDFCIGASHLISAGDQTRVGYFGQNNLRATPTITEFGDGLKVIGSGSRTDVTSIGDINVTFPSAYLQFNAECTDIGDDYEIVVVTNTPNGGIKIEAEL